MTTSSAILYRFGWTIKIENYTRHPDRGQRAKIYVFRLPHQNNTLWLLLQHKFLSKKIYESSKEWRKHNLQNTTEVFFFSKYCNIQFLFRSFVCENHMHITCSNSVVLTWNSNHNCNSSTVWFETDCIHVHIDSNSHHVKTRSFYYALFTHFNLNRACYFQPNQPLIMFFTVKHLNLAPAKYVRLFVPCWILEMLMILLDSCSHMMAHFLARSQDFCYQKI